MESTVLIKMFVLAFFKIGEILKQPECPAICKTRYVLACSVVSDSATVWTVACQAPLSIGFSKKIFWNMLLVPPPGDLCDPGIEPMSPALHPDSLLLGHWGSP